MRTFGSWVMFAVLAVFAACGSKPECEGAACPSGGGAGSSGGGSSSSGGGTSSTGGGTASTGGGSAGGAPSYAGFAQYELLISSAQLPGTCFLSGAAGTAPELTLSVLTWAVGSKRFIGFQSGPVLSLGDSPSFALPDAIEGERLGNSFSARFSSEKSVALQFTEARQLFVGLTFDDGTEPTSGSLEIDSQFLCSPDRSQCPSTPSQTSCAVTRPITVVKRAVSPDWFAPSTPVPGAQKFLAAWAMQPVEAVATNPSCYVNQNLPSGAPVLTTENTRTLTVIQVAPAAPATGACSCATGCCLPDGTCSSGDSPDACGTNGASCRACARSDATCVSNTCSGGSANSHALDAQTALLGLESIRLGQSPTIHPPARIGASGPGFSWAEELREDQALSFFYVRRTEISTTAIGSGAGQAALSSQFTCVDLTHTCASPPPEPDAASCSVVLDFTATRID